MEKLSIPSRLKFIPKWLPRGLGVIAFGIAIGASHDRNAVVIDPDLKSAIGILSSYPVTRPLVESLYLSGFKVVYENIGGYGEIQWGQQKIVVDKRHNNAHAITKAAILAHELTHLKNGVEGKFDQNASSTERCYEEETDAYDTQLAFWKWLYGSEGKVKPENDTDQILNQTLIIKENEPERYDLLLREVYTTQCEAQNSQ